MADTPRAWRAAPLLALASRPAAHPRHSPLHVMRAGRLTLLAHEAAPAAGTRLELVPVGLIKLRAVAAVWAVPEAVPHVALAVAAARRHRHPWQQQRGRVSGLAAGRRRTTAAGRMHSRQQAGEQMQPLPTNVPSSCPVTTACVTDAFASPGAAACCPPPAEAARACLDVMTTAACARRVRRVLGALVAEPQVTCALTMLRCG